MKKRIGIAFIILLTLALTPGCSKKGAKDEAPAATSKTVDLGEVDDSAAGDEAKNDAKGAKADKDSAKGDKDSANADKAGKAEKDEKDATKPETRRVQRPLRRAMRPNRANPTPKKPTTKPMPRRAMR